MRLLAIGLCLLLGMSVAGAADDQVPTDPA